MKLSLTRFHWIRFIGAVCALLLALLYLAGFEQTSLGGFVLIGVYGAVTCVLLQRGTQPALCDLCGKPGTMKAEYGHGFTNARLILSCPGCGRVVNTARQGVSPGRDTTR